ncbi:MAG: PQQ-dependent sugar dehydrogenase [Acidobacteriota bacterium]|nr:PQQ-dependent sugar dehydrogenase [Acidobacteriota bacterium]
MTGRDIDLDGALAMTFYRGDAIRALQGDLVMASSDGSLARVRLDRASRVSSTERLVERAGGPIRALTTGPDGAIYFFVGGEQRRLIGSR